MKKSVSILLFSTLNLGNQCFAQSSVEEFNPKVEELNPNQGTMLLMLVVLTIIGLIFISFRENKLFKSHHPEYQGKILWTLIVFPIWIMINSIFDAFVLLFLSDSLTFEFEVRRIKSIFTILNPIVILYLWFKIRNLVQNFSVSKVKILKQFVIFLYGYIILSSLIVNLSLLGENKDYSVVNETQTKVYWLISCVVIITILYFSIRKINKLSQLNLKDVRSDKGNSVDKYNKLVNLDKLYNAGILNQEEFEKIKKEILDTHK